MLATNLAGVVGVGLDDGRVVVRRPAGDETTLQLDGGPVTALAISADGTSVAASTMDPGNASAPRPIQLWELGEGRVTTISGHDLYVSALSFSPDGSRLASGSDDRTVRIWRADGSAEAVLHGHADMVLTVEWIDSATVVSGGQDGTIRLWDVPSCLRGIGGPLASGLDGAVVDAVLDEERSALVVAQGNATVTWPIGSDVLGDRACSVIAGSLDLHAPAADGPATIDIVCNSG